MIFKYGMYIQAQYISSKRWHFTILQSRILLNQRTLDYKKECQVPFGAYVQAHNQPTYTNNNAPRTLDAIYLRPAQNMQGQWP